MRNISHEVNFTSPKSLYFPYLYNYLPNHYVKYPLHEVNFTSTSHQPHTHSKSLYISTIVSFRNLHPKFTLTSFLILSIFWKLLWTFLYFFRVYTCNPNNPNNPIPTFPIFPTCLNNPTIQQPNPTCSNKLLV